MCHLPHQLAEGRRTDLERQQDRNADQAAASPSQPEARRRSGVGGLEDSSPRPSWTHLDQCKRPEALPAPSHQQLPPGSACRPGHVQKPLIASTLQGRLWSFAEVAGIRQMALLIGQPFQEWRARAPPDLESGTRCLNPTTGHSQIAQLRSDTPPQQAAKCQLWVRAAFSQFRPPQR